MAPAVVCLSMEYSEILLSQAYYALVVMSARFRDKLLPRLTDR
jgi:hypothetical protein